MTKFQVGTILTCQSIRKAVGIRISGITRSTVTPAGPEVAGESSSGGQRAQPPDAEKDLILQLHVLRIA